MPVPLWHLRMQPESSSRCHFNIPVRGAACHYRPQLNWVRLMNTLSIKELVGRSEIMAATDLSLDSDGNKRWASPVEITIMRMLCYATLRFKNRPESSAKCNKPPQTGHDTSRTRTAKSWYSNNHPDISRMTGKMAGVPLPDAFVNSAENRRFCAHEANDRRV